MHISNPFLRSAIQTNVVAHPVSTGSLAISRLRAKLISRRTRRRALHVSLIALNVFLLGIVGAIVLLNPSKTGGTPVALASTADNTVGAAQPVDLLASVNVAVTVATMTNLPETPEVINQSDSARIQLAIASTSNTLVSKPQAVSSAFVSNKDIKEYVVAPGDTVASIASKFGVSSDSILWSNGLLSSSLAAGKKLLIPPVNGIVYTVQNGDTIQSLASKYRSSEDKLVAYNDAEINGINVGEQIIIPDGQITAPRTVYYGLASGFAWGGSAIYGYNGYAWGNCTWYVASQIQVPANWGNAATWAAGARAAGWHVSGTPSVGAIAQNSWMAGGLGHVAIVDGVSDDGSQVLIRDMNGIAGFDRVGQAWQPTSYYPNYITR